MEFHLTTTRLLESYAVLGPGAWTLLSFAMIKARKRMRLLARPSPFALPDPAPRVCVLVPVKDEAAKLDASLHSILAQDYPDFHVIAIDDRSTDGTGRLLDELAAANRGRLEVVHVRADELPAGWAGKPHALHLGVRRADALDAWFLFVDSDVVIAPDALSTTIAVCEHKRYDLMSLLPRFEGRSFWERLIIPLCAVATCAMYLVPFTNYNELPWIAFANGQFLCVRRSAYEAVGGHAAVRGSFSEDVQIARKLKRARRRPRIANGEAFASTRMYDSLSAIVAGWSRNFFSASAGWPFRIVAAMAFVVGSAASMPLAMSWGAFYDWRWPTLAAAHLGAILLALSLAYRWTGNSMRYALLYPLGGAMLLAVWARALMLCVTRRVSSRGTSYAYRLGHGVAPKV